jgi:hypothetical protein
MTAPPLDRRSRSRRHTALHRTLVEGEQFLYRGRRRQLELDAFQQPRRLEFGVDGTDELPQTGHTSATIGTNAVNGEAGARLSRFSRQVQFVCARSR